MCLAPQWRCPVFPRVAVTPFWGFTDFNLAAAGSKDNESEFEQDYSAPSTLSEMSEGRVQEGLAPDISKTRS